MQVDSRGRLMAAENPGNLVQGAILEVIEDDGRTLLDGQREEGPLQIHVPLDALSGREPPWAARWRASRLAARVASRMATRRTHAPGRWYLETVLQWVQSSKKAS